MPVGSVVSELTISQEIILDIKIPTDITGKLDVIPGEILFGTRN